MQLAISSKRSFLLGVCMVGASVQPLYGQEWRAQERLRLGDADDVNGTTFGRVTMAIVDADNRIWVADALSYNVRVFGPSGRLERTIGQRGKGPGEFEAPFRLGLNKAQLWVSDTRLRRLAFFRADGRVDSTVQFRYAPPAGLSFSMPRAVSPDGSAILLPGIPGDLLASGAPVRVPLVRVFSTGKVDTLHMVDHRGAAVEVDLGGRSVIVRQPLPGTPEIGVSAAGDVVAIVDQDVGRNGSFRLTTKDGQGRVLGQQAVPYTPERVPEAWRDSVVRTFSSALSEDPRAQQQFDRRFASALRIPSTFPPVDRVLLGNDRTVWVRLATAAALARWRVFDTRGTPLGSIELPASVNVTYADRQRIVGIGTGPNDEPIVVDYAIVATPGRR